VRGHLITFEGSEGAGKTTQISLLLEKLEEHGVSFLLTREPGGTALGESIRHLLKFSGPDIKINPVPELLLFCASRAQLVAEVILPALQQGRVVVCDRFFDSTVVYQFIARGIGLKHMDALRELTLGEVWPDLTFVLDIDPKTARNRALRRTLEEGHDPDRIEAEPLEFYQKISSAYRQLAASEPNRVILIQAEKQNVEIADEIWKYVAHALKL
jgi:dTMP kinase